MLCNVLPEFRELLNSLFITHPEPAGGLAENGRAIGFIIRARANNFQGMLQLMRLSQDGDRVARHRFDAGGDPLVTPCEFR